MIAPKRDEDTPHMAETGELIESVQSKEASGQSESSSPPSSSLKIVVDDHGRANIPDRLIDPQGVFQQPMVLPGIDGFPFRGSIPDLKETDPETFRPQMGQQIFANVLNLSETVDLKYYQQILQLVGNGYAQISVEERKYDDSIKSWRVFIRWILYYGYIVQGANSNG